jgi:hypothetical protein
MNKYSRGVDVDTVNDKNANLKDGRDAGRKKIAIFHNDRRSG